MNFKRILIIAATLTIAQLSVSAANQTAAQWARAEKAKLDTINKQTLAAITKEAPDSYRKLFTAVKSDYKSDPVEITRIAALTQIIATYGKQSMRNEYANELLAAAKGATAVDVTCFFLDQLRWCATTKQTKGIEEFTSSDKKEVADLAAIAALASERNFESQQKDPQKNIYSDYSAELAKLRSSKKIKALLKGFDNADLRIAGIAMREAAQIDVQYKINGLSKRQAESINKKRIKAGKEETMLWAQKLTTTSDNTRKIMLLDMLGTRGNPAALTEMANYIGNNDTAVSQAAQKAMIKIDPKAYVAALPPVLKNLPASHTDIMKKSMCCVPIELIEDGLMKDYSTYSQAGKNATMETLKVRRSKKGVNLALAAINSSAAEELKNGYRLLRDCAGPEEAEVLILKLTKARHGRASDIQAAITGAAKRDTSGTYVKLLKDAWSKAKPEQKLDLLGTFGRIGDKKLLTITEGALKDSDKEIATAAVRALSAWDNNDSLKYLMSVALTSTDNKQRILAQRGIEKKLSVKGVKKDDYKKMWADVSKSAQGDAEMKTKLDTFFAK
ncbi:MAG: hypothetical protein PF904_08165 [Kiritimatiellae bacterium]|jgi:hypothetical protein|nr:hypothetical protein [Kiritimatiellia bacterium]